MSTTFSSYNPTSFLLGVFVWINLMTLSILNEFRERPENVDFKQVDSGVHQLKGSSSRYIHISCVSRNEP